MTARSWKGRALVGLAFAAVSVTPSRAPTHPTHRCAYYTAENALFLPIDAVPRDAHFGIVSGATPDRRALLIEVFCDDLVIDPHGP